MEARPARTTDAHAIALIHVRAWRSAYRGIIPDAVLAGLSVNRRESMWRSVIAERRAAVLVAETAGRIIGWIAVGPSRDQDALPEVAEIFAIHVDPAHWQCGAGRLLWESARDHLRQARFTRVTLWVLDANQRARQFYQSIGCAEDGARKRSVFEGVSLLEIRYSRGVGV